MIAALISVFGVVICLYLAIKASKDNTSTIFDFVADPGDD